MYDRVWSETMLNCTVYPPWCIVYPVHVKTEQCNLWVDVCTNNTIHCSKCLIFEVLSKTKPSTILQTYRTYYLFLSIGYRREKLIPLKCLKA